MNTRKQIAATLVPSQQPQKKKRSLHISLVSLFILGLGATVYALFFDLSPKETYFLAEATTYNKTTDAFSKTFVIHDDWHERRLEEPSKTTMKVGVTAKGLEAIDPNIKMFASIINSVKLKAMTQLKPKEAKGLVEVNVGLGGTDIISAEAYQTEQLTGLSVPLLYDKYLYVDNEAFGSVMDQFNSSYQGPEKLQNFVKMQLDSMDYQTKLEKYGKEYGKFLMKYVKDEDIQLEDGVQFEGKRYRQLTLTLSESEVKEITKATLNKIQNDEELIQLLVTVMHQPKGMLLNANTDRSVVKTEVVHALKEAETIMHKLTFPEGYKSSILIDNQELIVKRDIDFKIGNDVRLGTVNYTSHALRTDGVITNGKWELNVYPSKGTKKDYLKAMLDIKGKPNTKGNDRKLTGTFAVAQDGSVTSAANVNVEMSGPPEALKTKFNVAFQDASGTPMPPVKGHFTRKLKDNSEAGSYASNGELGLQLNVGMQTPIHVVFDYESKTAFTDEFILPSVKKEGQNIADLKPPEIQEIMTKVQKRIQSVMPNHEKLPF